MNFVAQLLLSYPTKWMPQVFLPQIPVDDTLADPKEPCIVQKKTGVPRGLSFYTTNQK